MDADTQRLIDLGIEMRRLQKEYFKGRDKDILIKAKELEVRFDSLIYAIQDDDETGMFPY